MVMPYLSFRGNCEEAFLWYAEIFGGSIQHMVKYPEASVDAEAYGAGAQAGKVMHAQMMLTKTGGISGADAMWPLEEGNTVSIHAYMPDVAAAHRVFSALAEGGTVVSALETNPPPDDDGVSGCVRDRYGFSWIISAMKSA